MKKRKTTDKTKLRRALAVVKELRARNTELASDRDHYAEALVEACGGSVSDAAERLQGIEATGTSSVFGAHRNIVIHRTYTTPHPMRSGLVTGLTAVRYLARHE